MLTDPPTSPPKYRDQLVCAVIVAAAGLVIRADATPASQASEIQLQLGNPTMGATVATMMFVIILTGVLIYMFAWQRRVQTFEL